MTAPPTVPGIPAANSIPVSFSLAAVFASFESITPAPAMMVSSLFRTSNSVSRSVLMIVPRKPLSPTRRLLPFPIMYQDFPDFLQSRTASRSSSSDSGIMNRSAGPPTRKDVCRAIGSFVLISMNVSPFYSLLFAIFACTRL